MNKIVTQEEVKVFIVSNTDTAIMCKNCAGIHSTKAGIHGDSCAICGYWICPDCLKKTYICQECKNERK